MARKKITNFKIDEIKHLDGYWILFWVSKILISDSGEYGVKVVFVKLGSNLKESVNNIKYHNNNEKIDITIAYCPFLIMGSIWKDGKFKYYPASLNQSIDLTISNNDLIFKDSVVNFTNRAQFTGYPGIGIHSEKCVVIDKSSMRLPEDLDFILIPSFEIARYYHFKSDALTRKILLNQIGPNQMYYDSNSPLGNVLKQNTDTKKHVILTRDMYDSDALFVARIQYSRKAMESARQIASSVTAKSDFLRAVDCFFPFDGYSNIKVAGKNISLNGNNGFLVYQIRRCTGSFPFDELEFTRANDARQVENPDFENADIREEPNINHIQGNEPDELTGQVRPDHRPPKESIALVIDEEFPNSPKTNKITKDELKSYCQEEIVNQYHNTDTYSTNPATLFGSRASNAGIVTENEDDEKSNYLDDFEEALEMIKDEGYYCNSKFPTNSTNNYVFSSAHLKGSDKNWCYVAKNSKRKWAIPRRAIIALAVAKKLYFYFLEIERRNPSESYCTYLIHNSHFKALAENDLYQIMNEISEKKGVLKTGIYGEIELTKLKHTSRYDNRQGEDSHGHYYLLDALRRKLPKVKDEANDQLRENN